MKKVFECHNEKFSLKYEFHLKVKQIVLSLHQYLLYPPQRSISNYISWNTVTLLIIYSYNSTITPFKNWLYTNLYYVIQVVYRSSLSITDFVWLNVLFMNILKITRDWSKCIVYQKSMYYLLLLENNRFVRDHLNIVTYFTKNIKCSSSELVQVFSWNKWVLTIK